MVHRRGKSGSGGSALRTCEQKFRGLRETIEIHWRGIVETKAIRHEGLGTQDNYCISKLIPFKFQE